jgi:DNA replication licensing factor MCM6
MLIAGDGLADEQGQSETSDKAKYVLHPNCPEDIA